MMKNKAERDLKQLESDMDKLFLADAILKMEDGKATGTLYKPL